MALIDVLESVASLDAFENLIQSEAWRKHLASMTEASDSDEIERLRHAVTTAKSRLSPEHECPELQTLKEQVYAGSDPDEMRDLLVRVAQLRATLPIRRHERLFGQVETVLGQMFSPALSGTGYSNRARRARDLFNEVAGRTKIDGAASDKHGNAAGAVYDLGRDGAFVGHSVHVLHLYSGEGFDFKKPTAAFARKGFEVVRRTAPGTPAELARWLDGAEQLWLISNSKPVLNAGHIEAIRAFWQRGGGLYIWGDNDPYYADANAVLSALFGDELSMTGNVPGAKIVHEFSPSRRGFLAHLVTTGIEQLFEGITVASLDEAVTMQYNFAPLLYGSAGNLITVVRDPTPAAGAVMVDGAFTRLYCQWDEAGSARYVCNAACFLAAMALAEEEVVEEAPSEPDALPFDAQGAFRATCDLTGKTPANWLVLSVQQKGDALANTSDFVLTDPLAFGARNCIFSDRVYDEQMGPWIVEQGTDPFTHKPVIECLPLVDLSDERNLREFTRLLCKCLMGGKYLPTAARLLFFAVVDQMLDESRRGGRRKAWEYLYRQCLANFTSAPEFTEVGRKMPLLDAMAAYFSPATDAMVQVRKTFTTVGVIGRTLLREQSATRPQVRAVARRALVKALVADAVAAEKAAPDSMQPGLIQMLYRNFHGIPKLNGGRIVEGWPEFASDLSADRERLERALEGPLLSASEQTAVLHALLGMDLRQYTAESAVGWLLIDSPSFAAVWHGAAPDDVVKTLNSRFAAYQEPFDLDERHLTQVPPFVTTYGPSVYQCVCGKSFGDPEEPITDESIQALAEARKKHFRKVYRATSGEGWYPAEGTLHFNLHRAVQNVVKEKFPDATEVTEEMTPAVAAYLLRDGKGFIYHPSLSKSIRTALESYLALRREGQPHPEGVLTVRVKAEQERKLVYGLKNWRQRKPE